MRAPMAAALLDSWLPLGLHRGTCQIPCFLFQQLAFFDMQGLEDAPARGTARILRSACLSCGGVRTPIFGRLVASTILQFRSSLYCCSVLSVLTDPAWWDGGGGAIRPDRPLPARSFSHGAERLSLLEDLVCDHPRYPLHPHASRPSHPYNIPGQRV